EGSQAGLLVGVRHAEDPAEVRVHRRLGDLGGEGRPRLAERVLQRVDDERGRNGLGHPVFPGGGGVFRSRRRPLAAGARRPGWLGVAVAYLETPQTRAYPAAQWFQPLTLSRHPTTCGT